MAQDQVDKILQQWQQARPDLDCSTMGVIGRTCRSAKLMTEQMESLFSNYELSFIEFDILATLKRSGEPLTPTQLYQTLMLSSGAMSTRIEALVKRGLVQRLASSEDRRSCQVALTEAGTKLIDEAATLHVANQHAMLSSLTSAEQEQLAGLLRKWLLSAEE